MSDHGPFDRTADGAGAREGTARAVFIAMAVLGVVLLALVLLPLGIFNGGSGGGSGANPGSAAQGAGTLRVPKVPDGYEALSQLLRPAGAQDTGAVEMTVSLIQPVSDGRNLGLYTYRNGKWERLAPATLVNNGSAARGQVPSVPANVAVLRRTASAAHVSGWVVSGAQVDPAALDILSVINPVDFHPGADGAVIGTPSVLNSSGKPVIPTVRAIGPAEIEAVNTILASPQLREAHVNALVQVVQQGGYAGIEIDYPAVTLANKPNFTAFISVLAERLHATNRQVSVVLPMPLKTGISWDTGAFDWRELGRVTDSIKLVPELDPSTYYRRMEEVVAFLKPNVDLTKVSLIIGRASREKASNGIRQMPLREALSLASALEVRNATAIVPNASVQIVGKNIYQDDGASGIRWDEEAFAVSFSYPGAGGQRTVWFENALSVAFRIDFARRMGLGGVHLDDVALDPQSASLWEPFLAYVETGFVKLVQPNGILLRPVWSSQAGALEQGPRGNVVWKAPAQAGVYDVSLIVSDGVVRAAQKLVLDVRPAQATPVPTGAAGTPRPVGTATPTR